MYRRRQLAPRPATRLTTKKPVVDLPFAFPFAGDTLRRVVVSANGSQLSRASSLLYPLPTFSFEISTATAHERALIAPWYTDLNPGAAGSVHARRWTGCCTCRHMERRCRNGITSRRTPSRQYCMPSGQIDFNYVRATVRHLRRRNGHSDSKPPAWTPPLCQRSDADEHTGKLQHPGLDQFLASGAVD